MAKENKLDYEINYILAENLSVVWAKAQRPFNEKWAKEIAENFDPDKFEPIIVTKPNGEDMHHVVEGQHRHHAAMIYLGAGQRLPCRVIDHADPARAAEIFLGINAGRKGIRPVVAFLVAVEAKRSIEVAINNIVRRAGYHISENTAQDNCIASVAVLKKIYNRYGDKILMHTLEACRLLWGSDPKGVNGSMLAGFALFLNEFHEHVEAKRLRTVIQDKYKSPWKLIDAANYAKEKTSEPLNVALAELIRKQYNASIPLREQSKRLKRKEI